MSAHRPKVALVDATEAKNRFGALIKRAYEHEEHLIVRRGGLPGGLAPPPAAPLAAVEQDVDAAVKAVRQAARRGPVPAAPLTTRTAGRRAARRR